MITTVSLQTQRVGFLARLWMSCCGDLAAYGDGLIRDFGALTADLVAAWLLTEKVVIATVVAVNMARLRGRAAKALGFLAVLIGFGAVAWNLHVIG